MAAVLQCLLLDQPCLDSDLVEISQLIHDWREIAPFLGLTQADEQNIIGYAPHSVPVQKITMLRTWGQRHGPAATYSRLANAFRQCGRQDLVERVSVLADRRETTRLSIGEPCSCCLRHALCCRAIYSISISVGIKQAFPQLMHVCLCIW